jgi:hypothetical protein
MHSTGLERAKGHQGDPRGQEAPASRGTNRGRGDMGASGRGPQGRVGGSWPSSQQAFLVYSGLRYIELQCFRFKFDTRRFLRANIPAFCGLKKGIRTSIHRKQAAVLQAA